MNSRMKLLLLAVTVLVLVNLWRWWPQVEQSAATTRQSQQAPVTTLELRLAGYDPDAAGGEVNIRRDLFFPVSENGPASDVEPKPVSQQPVKPQNTSRREQVIQDMQQYRLVGVLSRNGVFQGFLVRDEENFSVRQGDRLENRYSVEAVSPTSVTLGDPDSRVSLKIELE